MGVCMYRTISHLPPKTLLRNEITQARPNLNLNLNPNLRVRPACLNPKRLPGHVCTISHLPPKTLLRNEITQARPACLSPAFGCHEPQLLIKGAAAQ